MIEKVAKQILESKYMTALTGAGISAESGIPTFRGEDGLWKKFKAEELATPSAFRENPELVWEWYKWRMEIVFNAKPNLAHNAFAELEKMGILKMLITQNVDDLHEKAGSKKVLHLHGSLRILRCTACKKRFEIDKPPIEKLPKCECGALLRPGVVWFGEEIPSEILREAIKHASMSDLMIVVGTSAVVQPAASLPLIVKKNKGLIIEINPEETPLTNIADISLRMKAGEAMDKLVKLIQEL